MMYYKQIETPIRYGIIFSEAVGSREETNWYDSKDERDYAIEYLIEYGSLDIPVGRTIIPRAFNAIDAAENYFKLI